MIVTAKAGRVSTAVVPAVGQRIGIPARIAFDLKRKGRIVLAESRRLLIRACPLAIRRDEMACLLVRERE